MLNENVVGKIFMEEMIPDLGLQEVQVLDKKRSKQAQSRLR